MVLDHARSDERLDIGHVDIAPRGRGIHELSVLGRVVRGAPQMLWTVLDLRRRIKHHRPDVVHLTTSGQLALIRDLVMLLLCRANGIPTVYHIRFGRLPALLAGSSVEGFLFKRAAALADRILTLEVQTQEAVAVAVPGRAVERLPNPVNLDALPHGMREGSGTGAALFVGWVIPTKGIDELVEAWCDLRPPGWNLTIVGPGDEDYLSPMKERARSAGVEIRFTGALSHDDAMALMAVCELFLLPSHTEGFPNVIAEAMALGRCIIASDVGAIGGMLADGRGIVVPPRDAAALRTAIRAVLDDQPHREALGSAAREWANRSLGLPAVFDAYVRVWRSLCRPSPDSREQE